jgi:hypothetical protein
MVGRSSFYREYMTNSNESMRLTLIRLFQCDTISFVYYSLACKYIHIWFVQTSPLPLGRALRIEPAGFQVLQLALESRGRSARLHGLIKSKLRSACLRQELLLGQQGSRLASVSLLLLLMNERDTQQGILMRNVARGDQAQKVVDTCISLVQSVLLTKSGKTSRRIVSKHACQGQSTRCIAYKDR